MLTRLERFYLSAGHNFFGRHGREPSSHASIEATELHCVAGRGIIGDRFFDYRPDYAGQITFFSSETFDVLQRKFCLPTREISATRRNVMTRGIDLDALRGAEFCLQGVWFRGAGECKPCYWMNDALAPGAEEWLRGKGGLRARILNDGALRLGAVDLMCRPASQSAPTLEDSRTRSDNSSRMADQNSTLPSAGGSR
jgi:MOSC domain-containing protein YiiM